MDCLPALLYITSFLSNESCVCSHACSRPVCVCVCVSLTLVRLLYTNRSSVAVRSLTHLSFCRSATRIANYAMSTYLYISS
jgi:hypothetical protein